jgi:hypothetical protein
MMARPAVALALCLGLLGVGSAVVGDLERETEVLKNLLRAERATAYTGVLITKESPQAPGRDFVRETKQRLWHAPGGKYRLEPIEPPILRGNLVIDDGTKAYHVFARRKAYLVKPAAGSWLVGPMLQRLEPAQRSGAGEPMREFIRRSRMTLLEGRRTIAGREALGLTIEPPPPPDGPAVRVTLWVDARKWVILGVERHGPEGKVVSHSEFESIEFPGTLDEGLFVWRPPPDMQEIAPEWGLMSLREAGRRLGFRIAVPRLRDGATVAGYVPEHEDTVEVVPFRPRGENREDDGSIPLAVMRFHKDRYVLSLFQSSPRVLARDIRDKDDLARKIRELRRGQWDEGTHSYTWVLGEGGELRLLRLQAPPEMTPRKVAEIARSVQL